jgi:hypothetical protein
MKYLFFLLGLCLALSTLTCASLFISHSAIDGPCCFCCPIPTARVNRMRAMIWLPRLPEDSTTQPDQTQSAGRSLGRNWPIPGARRMSFGRRFGGNETPRSGRLWSSGEVPVLHGVVCTLYCFAIDLERQSRKATGHIGYMLRVVCYTLLETPPPLLGDFVTSDRLTSHI